MQNSRLARPALASLSIVLGHGPTLSHLNPESHQFLTIRLPCQWTRNAQIKCELINASWSELLYLKSRDLNRSLIKRAPLRINVLINDTFWPPLDFPELISTVKHVYNYRPLWLPDWLGWDVFPVDVNQISKELDMSSMNSKYKQRSTLEQCMYFLKNLKDQNKLPKFRKSFLHSENL